MNKLNEGFETGCCKRFNPGPWDEKEVTWNEKLFVKDHIINFFRMPLNFGRVVTKNIEKIKAAEALSDEVLVLSDEKSLWGSDLYIAVIKDVPNSKMVKLSGTYLTKVFEGPYKNAGRWAREMAKYVKDKGKEVKKIYFWYTTCPTCAKAYGKNYTVLVAKV